MEEIIKEIKEMIKSKEEYYGILERLRALNFNQKLSRNLQAKLEAFEEMEELVNLTIPVVSQCACTPDETTGTTTVRCCNICGKPAESFWHCG